MSAEVRSQIIGSPAVHSPLEFLPLFILPWVCPCGRCWWLALDNLAWGKTARFGLVSPDGAETGASTFFSITTVSALAERKGLIITLVAGPRAMDIMRVPAA